METMICACRHLQRDSIMRTMMPLVVVVVLIYPVCSTSYCTKKMSEERFREKSIRYPCKQSYQSRCSFFSFSYCTFYRNFMCDRSVNESYTYYFADKICCPGWTMMPNRTCVPTVSTLPQSSEDKSKMSIGVYAGIAAAGILVIVVSVLVIIRVLKRRRQKQFIVNEHLHAEQKIALKIMNNQDNEENQQRA